MFEELDYRETPLGELILRRRSIASMPGEVVHEVLLGGRFLMSSLVRDSEEALARTALGRLRGDGWNVLVGGLGLGHTAAAALELEQVARLTVVELLPEVLDWHRRALVPLGRSLVEDPRCALVQGDCFAWLRGSAEPPWDAVLLDIDHSPEHLLDPAHRGFYTADGLRAARRCLAPGGVLAVWSSEPPSGFADALRRAFGNAEAETVRFRNPLLDRDDVNTVYLATNAGGRGG